MSKNKESACINDDPLLELFHWHFWQCWFASPLPFSLLQATPEMDLLWSGAKASPTCLQMGCGDISPTTDNRLKQDYVVILSSCVCRRSERNMFLKLSVTVCSALSSSEANLCALKSSLSPVLCRCFHVRDLLYFTIMFTMSYTEVMSRDCWRKPKISRFCCSILKAFE